MKTSVIRTIAIALLLAMPCGAGEIYKIVDPRTGKVTYTDTPPTAGQGDAISLDLPPVNTQQHTPAPQPPSASEREAEEIVYRNVEIVQPADDSTIPPGQLNVVVQVSTTPTLQAGHRVRFLLNEQAVGAPISGTSLVIDELNRGSHQLRAQILDRDGHLLRESAAVTIHVKRGSVRFNP
ncbi:MAG: DUF4124 domain-containing protein [Porticoccaceae bacterium]